jgi:acyl-coenzyme A synthetase/AMP-(fatty) acid ligase
MPFNRLANLLLANRQGLSVSFVVPGTVIGKVASTVNGAITNVDETHLDWDHFLDDIYSLMLQLKTQPCEAVAICCEDSYLFSVAFFACCYADKKIVLPSNHQPAMLTALSSHFDLLIEDGAVTVKATQSITLPITLQINKTERSNIVFSILDANAINITLFTSGSTGTPKAINKTLQMLDEEIQALERQWGELLSESLIVSTVSHQHIYGLLFRILWPLCAGRPFASHDLIYPEQIIKNGSSNQILISSPALLKRLQNEGKLTNYRAVFSSGGPLSNDVADRCKMLLNQYPIEVFGSTETGGIGFRQQSKIDTAWQFFPEVEVKLMGQDCLALCSPWLNKELNKDLNRGLSKGTGGYYQTSDQCELLANHQFRLIGRVDRIVKIEEKRISLQEVENRLNELEWVNESVVLMVDEPHRITLGALLTLTEQGHQTLLELGKGRFWIQLRQALRDWVEPVGIPRHFRVTQEIPMNKQGKRLQQEIAELFK